MRRRLLLAAALSAAVTGDVVAEPPVVAVFDLEDTRPKRRALAANAIRDLSAYLASQVAEGSVFRVVPRDQVRNVLLEQKADSFRACFDQSCQIELGKALAAAKSLGTTIRELDQNICVVTASLYDLRTEVVEDSASARGGCSRKDVLQHLDAVVQKIRTRAAPSPRPREEPAKPAGAQVAKQFVDRTEAELKRAWSEQALADWAYQTDLTPEKQRTADAKSSAAQSLVEHAARESAAFSRDAADAETRRKLDLLRSASSSPAPLDAARAARLAELAGKLQTAYGTAKDCTPDGQCRTLADLSKIVADGATAGARLEAWTAWHAAAAPMRALYPEYVALSNEGARALGFRNIADLRSAGFEMSSEELAAEMDRLWGQVKPLYEALHCHVRAKLETKWGHDAVTAKRALAGHLLGNMWAQDWSGIASLAGGRAVDTPVRVTEALAKKGFDGPKMVKLAESFYVSLGFAALPQSFWEHSLLSKPAGRDVVCHASAWDLSYAGDVRLKICAEPTARDLTTIHHELGHIYYYLEYRNLPVLFQRGANEGFHEGVSDAITLSMTPEHLARVGLLEGGAAGTVDHQLEVALATLPLLAFARVVDQWQADVFGEHVGPDRYNRHWNELRARYQGVAAPSERGEELFDPGAKYHVAANVSYARYFFGQILRFQLHRAFCREAGHRGPLSSCSIYGNKAAGKKVSAMMALGARRPWPDALEAAGAGRRMDGEGLVEYFEPLSNWLRKQNQRRKCGW